MYNSYVVSRFEKQVYSLNGQNPVKQVLLLCLQK